MQTGSAENGRACFLKGRRGAGGSAKRREGKFCRVRARRRAARAYFFCKLPKIVDMKGKIRVADEMKTRDERESCIPPFAAAEEKHGQK